MKKLKLNLAQLNNTQVLTRSQLRNVLGGGGMGTTMPGGGGETTVIGGCPTKCTGLAWNSKTMSYEHATSTCIYSPQIGQIPASCNCNLLHGSGCS